MALCGSEEDHVEDVKADQTVAPNVLYAGQPCPKPGASSPLLQLCRQAALENMNARRSIDTKHLQVT
eukprot:8228564-Lingulodinium_polyedra.AAC.1